MSDSEESNQQSIRLDDFIGAERANEIARANNNTEYDVEQANNEYSWQLAFRKNIVASIIGIIIIITMVVGIGNDLHDIEIDIAIIKEDQQLSSIEKTDQIAKLRNEIRDRHQQLIVPLLTLILGYYFGTSNKNDS